MLYINLLDPISPGFPKFQIKFLDFGHLYKFKVIQWHAFCIEAAFIPPGISFLSRWQLSPICGSYFCKGTFRVLFHTFEVKKTFERSNTFLGEKYLKMFPMLNNYIAMPAPTRPKHL